MKRALIIYNPTAGDESGKDYASLLEEGLMGDFDDIILRETQKEKDATILAKKACEEGLDSLFAIGGDGTINEVINGLIQSDAEEKPILGVIPAGTYNGLARVLNIPMDVKEAIRNLDLTSYEPFDLGESNHDIFTFVLAIGDVSEAVHNVTSEEKAMFSSLAYFFNIVKDQAKNSHYNLNISVDGKDYSGKYSHVVITLSTTLDFYEVTRGIQERADGYLHVFLYKEGNLFTKLELLADMVQGKVESNEEIIYLKGRQVQIESADGSKVETDHDGEPADYLPVEVNIVPKAIQVYSLINREKQNRVI